MPDEKQYRSLYRKYRPQGPDEVLGQEHVIRALMGGVRENRLAHAFLFTGPRGTGKTSTARILAKMVNCEKGPTPEPCGVCQQCELIREGGHLDVVEIDAASHTGVEDARDLREKAPTAPVIGREKVYIIDEVQRLSPQAFDALLKLFEEPPQGVRFILATTDPHKIPATIIGRCQRFDFRRVPLDTLAGHLERIAKDEDIVISRDAAEAIARHCEGSVRDSLSLLDQAALLGDGTIGEAELDALLGTPPSVVQDSIADAIATADTRRVFEIVHDLVQGGQDLRHVTSETLGHLRNLLIANAAPDEPGLLDVTEDEYERLKIQAQKFTPHELSRVIALLLAAQSDMRWTTSPRITLELALVRATMPASDPDTSALLSRIERLERRSGLEVVSPEVSGGIAPLSYPAQAPLRNAPASTPAAPAPPAAVAPAASAPSATTPTPAPVQPAMPIATGEVTLDTIRRNWGSVVTQLRATRQMILATNLETATPVAFDGATLEVMFPADRVFGIKKVMDREKDFQLVFKELFGVGPKLRCVTRDAVSESVSMADEMAEEDDGPTSDEDAVRRLAEQFGAQPIEEPKAAD